MSVDAGASRAQYASERGSASSGLVDPRFLASWVRVSEFLCKLTLRRADDLQRKYLTEQERGTSSWWAWIERRAGDAALTDHMAHSALPEVQTLRSTLVRWRREVTAYFLCRLTNARTEGYNGKAKLVIRRAYGYKSFRNYRLRLLNACA